MFRIAGVEFSFTSYLNKKMRKLIEKVLAL